jgi:hypothetical protein
MRSVIPSEAKDLNHQISRSLKGKSAQTLRALCAPSVSSVVKTAVPRARALATSNRFLPITDY